MNTVVFIGLLVILFALGVGVGSVPNHVRLESQEQVINKLSRERSDLLLQRDYCYSYLKKHKDEYQ